MRTIGIHGITWLFIVDLQVSLLAFTLEGMYLIRSHVMSKKNSSLHRFATKKVRK